MALRNLLSAGDRSMNFCWLGAGLTVVIGGCASMPSVKTNYSLTRAAVDFEVLRSVTCDAKGNVFIVDKASALARFYPDPVSVGQIDTRMLSGSGSDTTFSPTWYPGGRLKGINATSTGRGGEVVESAVKLALLAAGTGAPGTAGATLRVKLPSATCALVGTAEQKEAKTFKYLFTWTPDRAADPTNWSHKLDVTDESESFAMLFTALPTICAYAFPHNAERFKPIEAESDVKERTIKAREPSLVRLALYSIDPKQQPCPARTEQSTQGILWQGYVPVSQWGLDYEVPIPAPALFGSTNFEVAFDKSGALEKLTYGKGDGMAAATAAAANAAQQYADRYADQAARAEGEINAIIANEKLVRCRADPKQCADL
ncbi:hypothetical protein BOSP111201_12390 [Bordetella sputigena]|uniref:hypothetical protein n=1 Tax=Bordetella sputigena TaxID=1416810 RepID=UPI0039EE3701